MSGSSSVFLGGVPAIRHVKQDKLGVLEATLVSKARYEAVVEMSQGARNAFHADWGIAVSGIGTWRRYS